MNGFFSGYINLLKTAMGSGILTFPSIFSTYGVVPAFILTLFSACFSASGLLLYMFCSKKYDRSSSISMLCSENFPKLKFLVDFGIFIKCFGVGTSYLIIIRQLLPNVLQPVFGSNLLTQANSSTAIYLAIIASVCYFRNLNNLKYTSTCGIIAIFIVILTSIYRLFTSPIQSPVLYTSFSSKWIEGLGKLVFAFTCHQNIFSVRNELPNNSTRNLIRLIFATILTAVIAYTTFGLSNYLLYSSSVTDNILQRYSSDTLGILIQFLYVIVMGFSYPLQIIPARMYFCYMFMPKYNNNMEYVSTRTDYRNTNLDIASISNTNQITNTNLPTSHTTTTLSETIINGIVTTFLIIATYLIVSQDIKLGIVYTIIGATASTLMCLILPALFYLRSNDNRRNIYSFLSYFIFVVGIGIFCITIIDLLVVKNK
ncbi:transmembrane amino acid transporter [Hamiltosporidium tvaerminnensis]|uniref:Transmembrane amino acid transporter n=3 Tax=Hamiltosporidium TaxID=1176354 RepID=A0A4Q9M1J2_9MICR|nr:hypothetical protein LUQ84_003302 [Hamiltosporidium tvaerminnensis]TBU02532.1 transmembrane amino acid transporter [Hamiltosporidium tvaerminnensis]TBU20580.1 transmembrane amino acid transporter [Hamiltosporidium tvaerminnensis]TBU20699.1 transmembrane amino acid transporter [Hamiltosporidium tvaerminnensis]